jgi:hypothetical protein
MTTRQRAHAPKALVRVSGRLPRWSVSRAARLAQAQHKCSRLADSPTTRIGCDEVANAGSKQSLLLGLAAIGLASACGGRSVREDVDGGVQQVDGGVQQDAAGLVGFSDSDQPAPTPSGVSGSPDSAITSPMPTDDAAPPIVPDAESTACTKSGGGGGGGGGQCMSTLGELCGSTNYQVSCACPRGSCVCFGPTTHVVAFSGCPTCPALGPNAGTTTDDVLALCGFPH